MSKIEVEIIEATPSRNKKRVSLSFYQVSHHIDIDDGIDLAYEILRKTGSSAECEEKLRVAQEQLQIVADYFRREEGWEEFDPYQLCTRDDDDWEDTDNGHV